ncbi:hypothetical protein [Pseudomonas putida]|jgi:hypothetical protein|uniref:hypothetical protein n=1 Tax=Pseudomonas putida TaxID=303 RepID=UPI00066B3AB2|nr:hypothetical protein [Pseudomonas putida]EKT4505104.1 hypothetical protein [Pseudomonas putida]
MTKATTKAKATKQVTMTTQCEYGVDVIEFHKHCDEQLQTLIDKKQNRYQKGCETFHYKDKAAHIHWQRSLPMDMAVKELFEEMKKGYELVKLASNPPLDFWALLKKPAEVIEAELQEIAELAKQEYDQTRYELNAAETERQISITVFRKNREREAAAAALAAKAAAELQRDEQAEALADLRRAYAELAELAEATEAVAA